jgi:hypothetical protein
MADEPTVSRERDQLGRILASLVFQSSRLNREFLRYTAERALQGAPVDQTQIAVNVLGRRDFDPTTDASVRKLATQVRQRLERYYEEEGANDEIVIALPLRSYTPTFLERPANSAAPASVPPVPPFRQYPPRRWMWTAAVAVVCAAAAFVVWRGRAPAAPEMHVRILTERGDIVQPSPDAAPGAVRLGPALTEQDEVFAQLTFRPDHEGQHAGIAAWEAGDRWVSVGRRFTYRNVLTFGYEEGKTYRIVHEIGDIEGQSGAPVWLRLVRRGADWTAYWSETANAWQELGTVRLELKKPRAAVFGVNGRRESPSIPAEFRFAGAGAIAPEVWPCTAAGSTVCDGMWRHPAPEGSLSITTRMDMRSDPVYSAGLFLRGEAGRVRLVRYFSEGSRIALIRDGKLLESVPDYAGSPPVYLRLELKEGKLRGWCSVDGDTFRQVGNAVEADFLGPVREYGAVYSPRVGADSPAAAPPPRFFFVQKGI